MLKQRFFRRDKRSNAAMEFAIIAPILVILLFGVYELCNAAIVYEEVQNAAHSIPASASNLAVQSSGATGLSYNQIQLAASQIWAQIPELRTGFENGTLSVTITSVTFLKTLSNTNNTSTNCSPSKTVTCVYTPTVVWSVAYTGGNSGRNVTTTAIRSCTGAPTVAGQTNQNLAGGFVPGGLNSEAPTTSGIGSGTVKTWVVNDLTALPTYVVANPDPSWAAPSPILVVDVHVKYQPIFGLFVKSGVDFYGAGFFPIRSVQSSTVTTNGNTTTTTALTLSQQFTTILNDLATNGATQAQINAGVIPGVATGTYCINTSPLLSPAAQS